MIITLGISVRLVLVGVKILALEEFEFRSLRSCFWVYIHKFLYIFATF